MKTVKTKILSLVIAILMLTALVPLSALSVGAAEEPAFTLQPQNVQADAGEKATVTWALNFTPIQLKLRQVKGSTMKNVDLPLEATSVEIAPTADFDYYYILAYYEFSKFIPSNAFYVTETGELLFVDSNDYNVPAGSVGMAMEEIDVSVAVSGGTAPYTFSKESGPDWLNVSPDGKLTGTRPTESASTATAVIKVTDSASATKQISIVVNKISLTVQSIELEDITPEMGKSLVTPTIKSVNGSEALKELVMGINHTWYSAADSEADGVTDVYSGINWDVAETTVAADTWYDAYTEFTAKSGVTFAEGCTVTVNGVQSNAVALAIDETDPSVAFSDVVFLPFTFHSNPPEGMEAESFVDFAIHGKSYQRAFTEPPFSYEGYSFRGFVNDVTLPHTSASETIWIPDSLVTTSHAYYAVWDAVPASERTAITSVTLTGAPESYTVGEEVGILASPSGAGEGVEVEAYVIMESDKSSFHYLAVTPMSPTSTFKADKYYYYAVMLDNQSNYAFTDRTVYTVNGKTARSEYFAADESNHMICILPYDKETGQLRDYHCPSIIPDGFTAIESVDISGVPDRFVPGEVIDTDLNGEAFVISDPHAILNTDRDWYVDWYKSDSDTTDFYDFSHSNSPSYTVFDNETFSADKYYYLLIILLSDLEGGYLFTEDTVFTVNGKPAAYTLYASAGYITYVVAAVTDATIPVHTHDYKWKYDEENHWVECACGEKDLESVETHDDTDNDYQCDMCGCQLEVPTLIFMPTLELKNYELGKKVSDIQVLAPEGANYTVTVTGVGYFDDGYTGCDPDDVFTSEKDYNVRVIVKGNEGYEVKCYPLFSNVYDITLNGFNGTRVAKDTYEFCLPGLSEAGTSAPTGKIKMDGYKVGENASDVSLTLPEGYTVFSAGTMLVNDDASPASGTLEKDIYILSLTLNLPEGVDEKTFTRDTLTLFGAEANVIVYSPMAVGLIYYLPAPPSATDTPITKVEFTLEGYELGKNTMGTILRAANSTGFEIDFSAFSSSKNSYDELEEVLAAGKSYYYSMVLYEKENYTLASIERENITLNGKTPITFFWEEGCIILVFELPGFQPDGSERTPDGSGSASGGSGSGSGSGDPSAGGEASGGLPAGAIVGIAAGSAVVAGGGGFSLFWFVIKKKSWADLLAVFQKK